MCRILTYRAAPRAAALSRSLGLRRARVACQAVSLSVTAHARRARVCVSIVSRRRPSLLDSRRSIEGAPSRFERSSIGGPHPRTRGRGARAEARARGSRRGSRVGRRGGGGRGARGGAGGGGADRARGAGTHTRAAPVMCLCAVLYMCTVSHQTACGHCVLYLPAWTYERASLRTHYSHSAVRHTPDQHGYSVPNSKPSAHEVPVSPSASPPSPSSFLSL